MSLEQEQRLLDNVRATAETDKTDSEKAVLEERIALVRERLEHAKKPLQL
jgi:hypothetical protein